MQAPPHQALLKYIEMDNKYIRTLPISLAIRGIQIKFAMLYNFMLTRMARIQKIDRAQ